MSFIPTASTKWGGDQLSFDFEDDTIDKLMEILWDTTIDKMIWSFYQLTFNWEDQYYHGKWVDYAGLEEHERRIREGLALFAKYYIELWI